MNPRALVLSGLLGLVGCNRPPRPDPSGAATAQASALPAPSAAATGPSVPSTPSPEAPGAPTAPAPSTGPVGATPFERAVPPWDAATVARARSLFAEGQAAGLRADVFAKLGDSITESGSFAQDIGHGWYELGAWTRLLPVVQLFSRRAFSSDREDNSFSRASGSATAGWTTGHLLEGGDGCPLERELATLRPALAVLMIGTNDAEQLDVPTYTRNLGEILDRVARRKVVLLLSTIPELRSSPAAGARAQQINGVIRQTAAARHLPLIDYHAALAGLPNQGLSDDNIHPSAYVENNDTKAAVLTPAGLRHGYNVRNLTLLLGLERAVAALGIR